MFKLLNSTAVFMSDIGGQPTGETPANPEITGTEETAAEINPKSPMFYLSDETKIEAIKKAGLRTRQVFPTIDEAVTRMQEIGSKTENFYGVQVAVAGYNTETQTVDKSIYAGNVAVLATLGQSVDTGKGGKVTAIKGVVIYSVPLLDAILAAENGKDWVNKIMQKEAGLVAFRQFRDAETLGDFMDGVNKAPSSVSDYVAAAKRGDPADMEAFDALWPSLRDAMKTKMKKYYDALPNRLEIVKAIRSKSFAAANYPEAEEGGAFLRIANALVENADRVDPKIDASEISEWIANRETLNLSKRPRGEADLSVFSTMEFAL